MHQALYRKWRPRTFDEVCGQEHVTNVLKYEIISGKTSHAYLFCGSRGTGKTSCAKILAKAINCLDPQNGNPCCRCEACLSIDSGTATDIYEMDAASNNGVDDVRSIRDEVVYAPSEMKSRIYIIDEVHMLSDSAFNALLKTLEEPPTQVTFILATTEPRKVPATVLSRCQRFDFRRISSRIIADRLNYIASEDGIPLDDSASMSIARLSQGGMRDAISLLELCAGESGRDRVTSEIVERVSGSVSRDILYDTVSAVIKNDPAEIFRIIEDIYVSSKDISVFWQELIGYCRDLMIIRCMRSPELYIEAQTEDLEKMRSLAQALNMTQLTVYSRQLDDVYITMQGGRSAESKRVAAELALIRMSDPALSSSPDALLSRISAVENRLAVLELSGSPATPAVNDGAEKIKSETFQASKDEIPETDVPEVSSKKTLKSLNRWPDILEQYSAADSMTSSFLNGSKAYIDESMKTAHIVLKNSFAVDMLDKDEVKKTIAALIYSETAIKLTAGGVIFETSEKTDDSYTYMDEIIDSEQI